MSETPDRIESGDGAFMIERDGVLHVGRAINPLMHDGSNVDCPARGPESLVTQEIAEVTCVTCLRRIALTVADRTRAAAAFNAPEPHAYTVEVLHNPGRPSERWVAVADFEFEAGAREDAEAEMEEMREDGFSAEHLRVVGLVVVEP